MSRNYRNKRPSRTYTKKSSSSGNGKWIVIGIFIGLLAAVAFWQYQPKLTEKLSGQKSSHPVSPDNTTSKKQSAGRTHQTAAETQPTAPPTKTQTPEFDFYTVLPKMQVQPPNGTSSPATAKPPAATPPSNAVNPVNTAPAQQTAAPAPAATPVATAPAPVATTAVRPATPTTAPTAPPVEKSTHERYALQVASVKNYADADRVKAQLAMSGFEVMIQKYTVDGQTWNRVYVGTYNSREAALKQQANLKANGISSILIKQPSN